MPLDPILQHVVAAVPGMVGGDPDITPAQARERFRQMTVGLRRPEHLAPVASVQDLEVDGGDGPIAARLYRPDGEGPRPTVVFFHGGGFVIGDLDTHDDHARLLCRDAGAVVLSVAYGLAPERPWPGGVEDALAAARWAVAHVDRLGGDPDRIAAAGDSAGGNLAAIVAQELHEDLAAQLLIYPSVDHDRAAAYASRRDNATGYFLTKDDMRWFDAHYAGGGTDRRSPRLSPLHGTLAGAPPAVVVTAEYDPLRDEGDAYAEALRAAGVHVVHLPSAGMIHGFFGMGAVSPGAAEAVTRACRALRELLGGQSPSAGARAA